MTKTLAIVILQVEIDKAKTRIVWCLLILCPSARSKKTVTNSVFKARVLSQDYHLSCPEPPFFRVSVTERARALEMSLVVISS